MRLLGVKRKISGDEVWNGLTFREIFSPLGQRLPGRNLEFKAGRGDFWDTAASGLTLREVFSPVGIRILDLNNLLFLIVDLAVKNVSKRITNSL